MIGPLTPAECNLLAFDLVAATLYPDLDPATFDALVAEDTGGDPLDGPTPDYDTADIEMFMEETGEPAEVAEVWLYDYGPVLALSEYWRFSAGCNHARQVRH